MNPEIRRWVSSILVLALVLIIPQSHAISPVDTSGIEARVESLLLHTRENLQLNPESADAWGQMGMVLHAHGFASDALHHYEQAIERNAADYRWPYLAANAVRAMEPDKAAEFFAKAVSSEPDDHALLIAYGELLTRSGRFEAAQTIFRRALQINNSSGFANIGLARIALLHGDIDQAKLLSERARDQAPRNNEIHTLLSQIYAQTGDLDAANQAAWLAEAHKYKLQPHSDVIAAMTELAVSAQAYERRGNRLLIRGDYVGAETAFRQVLEIRMGSPQDLGNLATALAHLGRYGAAFELFSRSLSIDPDNVRLLNRAGRAYLDSGQLDRASELLGSAAEAAPNSAEVHLNLGLLRAQQGATKKTIEHLERALALDPSLRMAYLQLGSAYVGDGKLEAAVAVWQQLLTIERDNVTVLRKLGMLQVRLGNYEGAIVALEHAQIIEPFDSPTAILLTRLLATAPATSSRDAPRALAMAMTLFRARPHDPARIDLLGAAYAANGDFARATKLAERALNNALGNPRLAATIGEHLTRYQDKKPVLLPNGGVWMLF